MAGEFDFGLSSADESRARSLHLQSIVIDMVSMGLGGATIFDEFPKSVLAERIPPSGSLVSRTRAAWMLPYHLAFEGRSDAIRRYWDESGYTCASLPVSGVGGEAVQTLETFNELFYPQLPWLERALEAADIRAAKKKGSHAMFAYSQPGIESIPRDLKQIERVHALGLRSLMLTYNRMDHVGVGCTERVDAGLSNFGVDVVAACNDLGIIVDTSHCGSATTLDACRMSRDPVTANHTCAKGVHDHQRAKSDEALEAIAATGGIIGVVAVPFFLSNLRRPTIESMLDHIDYIVRRVGWQHVGIGTDFPLQLPLDVIEAAVAPRLAELGFRSEHNVDSTTWLVGYADGRDAVNITRGLVKRGYGDEQIRGILGENFLRVFECVCG